MRSYLHLMMASAQVVKTSVNTNNSPSQDYTANPNDHSNHNIDSPGFKPFTVISSGSSSSGSSSSSSSSSNNNNSSSSSNSSSRSSK